jgi:hypothetical protein
MALTKYSPSSTTDEELPDNQFITKIFDLISKEPGTLSLAVSVRITWTLYAMNINPPQSVHSKLC